MVVKKKKKTSEDLHNKRVTMARRCTKRKGKPAETEELPNKRGSLARRCTMKKEKPVESETEEEEEEEEEDLPNKRETPASRGTKRKGKPVETEDLQSKRGTTMARRRCTVKKGKPVDTEDLPKKREKTRARRCTVKKGSEDLPNKRETRRCTMRKGKPGETASIKAIFGDIDQTDEDLAPLSPPAQSAMTSVSISSSSASIKAIFGATDEDLALLSPPSQSISSSSVYAASMKAIDGDADQPHEDLAPPPPPAQSALTSVSISTSSDQCVESRLQVKMTIPEPATDVAVKEEPEDHWDYTTLQVTMAEDQGPLGEQGPLSEGSDIEDLDGDGYFAEFGAPNAAEPPAENDWMRVVLVKDEEEDVGSGGGGGEFQEADWKTENYHPRVRREFNREPGLKVELPESATPLQVFSKMFTEELFWRLVTETNAYAQESRAGLPETSRNRWTPVSVMEMKTFIGLCIAMGILKLPARRDYWRKTKWLYQTNFPQVMSRDRFGMIWRYLHLQDNHAEDVDRSDRLWKMRWFLDYLSSKFQSLYEVNGSVTVDETMVRFGRYHPHKHTKQGVKVWVMAESSTGYVTNFQVCTGRGRSQERAVAHQVVMDLAVPYYGSHLSIFMDNSYSGVELFQEMKRHGLNACGDVRSNRCGLLKSQTTEEAWSGNPEIKVAQKDDLTLCYWQDDAKFFSVLSNYHDPTEKSSVKRKKSASSQGEAVVPACISDYQKHIKGVDLLEQMVGYYQFQHRSQKWWRRLFFFFLSVACYNGYIAAKSVGGKPFTTKYRGYKYWLEDLAQELTVPVTTRRAPQRPSAPEGPPTEEHDFEKVFDKRKMCRECRSATRTVYGCRQCDEALHMECFGKHVRRFL